MVSLPRIPAWSIGGLKGGDDEDEDWVVMSDISDVNSGVDGAQERRVDDRLEALATPRSSGDPQDLFKSGIRDPSGDLTTVELLQNKGEDEGDSAFALLRVLGEGDCRKNRFFISSIASIEGRLEEGLDLVSGVPKRWRMALFGVVLCSSASGLLLCQNLVCGELLLSEIRPGMGLSP